MNPASTPKTAACRDRAEQLREQEWAMAQRLLALAATLITRLRLQTECSSPSQIRAVLDLASRLGRLSCAAPPTMSPARQDRSSLPPEVQDALDRVYGSASAEAAPKQPSLQPASNPQSPVAPKPGAGGPAPSLL